MRSEQEVNRAIEQYADMVFRLCMVNVRNRSDAEDIFQTVFLKYTLRSGDFESDEHEKAWLIRVTVNSCRDLLRNFFRSRTIVTEIVEKETDVSPEQYAVMESVWSLPKQYREIVYLHYYEGYSAPEIGRILKKNPNTVYTHLRRAKEMLKESLGGESCG